MVGLLEVMLWLKLVIANRRGLLLGLNRTPTVDSELNNTDCGVEFCKQDFC